MKHTSLPLPQRLMIGDTDYIITGLLAQENLSLVYQAHSVDRMDAVAVREFYPRHVGQRDGDDVVVATPGQEQAFEAARNHFIDEATMLFLTENKSFRAAEIGDSCFMAFDATPRVSLRMLMKQSRRQPAKAHLLSVFRSAGAHLASMHAAGYVHRTVSPSSLLVNGEDKAEPCHFDAMVHLNQSTPDVSPAEDIFGLGKAMLEFMTMETAGALAPKADQLVTVYGEKWVHSLAVALAKEPEDRWESMESWLTYLRDETAPDVPSLWELCLGQRSAVPIRREPSGCRALRHR